MISLLLCAGRGPTREQSVRFLIASRRFAAVTLPRYTFGNGILPRLPLHGKQDQLRTSWTVEHASRMFAQALDTRRFRMPANGTGPVIRRLLQAFSCPVCQFLPFSRAPLYRYASEPFTFLEALQDDGSLHIEMYEGVCRTFSIVDRRREWLCASTAYVTYEMYDDFFFLSIRMPIVK